MFIILHKYIKNINIHINYYHLTFKSVAEKYYCRTCKGERNHLILFQKNIIPTAEEAFETLSFIDKYLVIECLGCGCISFLNIYGDESMIREDPYGEPEHYEEKHIFPQETPGCEMLVYKHLLPEKIKSIYSETIDALNASCFLLAAGGFRAIIEAICNDLSVVGKSLSIKIDKLKTSGYLSAKESARLHSIRFVGNDSLHEIQTPKLRQLQIVLQIVNHLITNLYIQDRIIENNLDVLVVDYQKFTKLLNKVFSSEIIGAKKTLVNFLGKSNRLLDDLTPFELQLQQDIASGTYPHLSDTGTLENNKKVYEIISIPDLFSFEF